jgi:ligand-binding sensor domain-containing protein
VGTQEGLNRYDGREIVIFRNIQGDETSLSSNVIRAILEDDSGHLWIATSNGLNRYNAKNGTFQRAGIFDKTGQPVKKLYSLANSGNGELLIGTDGSGIYSIDTTQENYPMTATSILPEISSADVRVIFKDSRERLWVGTDGQGVWLTDKNQKVTNNFVKTVSNDSLSHNRIRAIKEDSKGQIWLGTRGGGLNKFDERKKVFNRYLNDRKDDSSLSNNRVYSILEDNDRTLWIATDGGLNLLASDGESFVRIKHYTSQPTGLSHNRILSLLESRSGLIWLGTMSGLDIWNPVTAKFVHYRNISEDKNTLSNNTVYGIAEAENERIYVATFGGGLNYFDPVNETWNVLASKNEDDSNALENRLMSLMTDKQKRLWVGSFSQGVAVLSKDHELIKSFAHDPSSKGSLSANGITDIIQDSDGEIWIATYAAGLNRLSNDEKTFKYYRKSKTGKGLLSDNVLQILEDDEGYLWLATDGGGIARLDKNTDEIISISHDPLNNNTLTGNSAWSIFQDSRGRFWIGTQGKGLNRWEPEARRNVKNDFIRYTTENGLPSSTVNGVLEDKNGYSWISTNKGLSRLDPETERFIHYGLALEIHDNELNQGAMLKTTNGRLYFGGLNGISAFEPNNITSNLNKPPVVLTNILSENKPLELASSLQELDSILFTHKDYLITFEFAALDYSQPDRNQYQYKLEGFDPDWVDGKNFNRATYTNLPSGQYLFKVKGSNNDGLWSDESINLQVTILPPPWATWWAFMIYSILFCGFLILLIRTQASRIANQDLFKKQVLKEIDTSTQALEIENEIIKNKLKNFEINSANDFETGLPNQTFFTEQVLISLAYLEKFKNQNSSIRLICLIIKTDCDEQNQNDVVAGLAETLADDSAINLVARWNKSELAILSFASSMSEVKMLVKSIGEKVSSHEKKNASLSIGYTVNPLNNLDNNAYKWENVLMLTEHTVRTASDSVELNSLGLLLSHQPLTPGVVRAAMSEHGLASLKENFETLTK